MRRGFVFPLIPIIAVGLIAVSIAGFLIIKANQKKNTEGDRQNQVPSPIPSQATQSSPANSISKQSEPSETEAKIISKTDIVTTYSIPEINTTITVPNTYKILNTNGSNLGGAFVRYDFELKKVGLNPQIFALQLFSQESIQNLNNKCEYGPSSCKSTYEKLLDMYSQKNKAFSLLQNYKDYKIKNYNGRYYFTSSRDCVGDTCTTHEFITFFDNTMILLRINSWEIENFQEIEYIFKSLAITQAQ